MRWEREGIFDFGLVIFDWKGKAPAGRAAPRDYRGWGPRSPVPVRSDRIHAVFGS